MNYRKAYTLFLLITVASYTGLYFLLNYGSDGSKLTNAVTQMVIDDDPLVIVVDPSFKMTKDSAKAKAIVEGIIASNKGREIALILNKSTQVKLSTLAPSFANYKPYGPRNFHYLKVIEEKAEAVDADLILVTNSPDKTIASDEWEIINI